MADRRDGLVGGEELAGDLEHARIQADVLGSTAAGDEQAGVVGDVHRVEIGGQREVVAAQLGVGLVAHEVMDGGAHHIARLLVGADRVHLVAQHGQGLERHHGLVVLGVITAQHQHLFSHTQFLLIAYRNDSHAFA